MRQCHRWTEAEQDIVRRDYQGTMASATAIANHLGVTVYAVKRQVQKLGITRHRMKDWTSADIEYLEDNIRRLSIIQIARTLKRSVTAVAVKCKKLKMDRRARDGWYTKKDVTEMLGVDHKWVQARIDSGALIATPRNGNTPHQDGSAMWCITEAVLRRYIVTYTEELVGRNVDLVAIVGLLMTGKEK